MSSSPLLEIRPKRRAKRRAEVEEEEDPIDPLVQAQQMEERTRDLMARQEEARTRRQLLRMRAELEREIRESEIPPSVDVSSEEEATEKPTEEPTEKPTEEPAEEPTEKPTEELAEEPTEKPTKELAKEDGESDEDAWGRWRWPTGDASASWHGTTFPMEPPEGPSVDALGRQKERDAATSRDGPTTALGRSSIWYEPEAEETVVPEGGAKKKKKKKKKQAWESAPVEEAPVEEAPVEEAPVAEAPVEEVPETPPYWACPVELFVARGFWAGGVGDAQDARRSHVAKVFLCPRISQFSVLTQNSDLPQHVFQCTSVFCMLSPSFGGWAAVSAQFCFVAG